MTTTRSSTLAALTLIAALLAGPSRAVPLDPLVHASLGHEGVVSYGVLAAVPEPATLLLALAGGAALLAWRPRRSPGRQA